MAEEKKIPKWFEALVGPGIDFFTHPILESFTDRFLQNEEREDLDEIRKIYWVRLHDPAMWATVRAALVSFFTVTGVVTAKLSELAGPLRDIIDEAVEQPINSMPRIVDTVIERRAKATAPYPGDYTVTSGEVMKAVGTIFQTRMVEDLRVGVERLAARLVPAKVSLERAGDTHLRVLNQLPKARQLEILNWFNQQKETPEVQEKYLRVLRYMNEAGELLRFHLMTMEERTAWITYVYEVRKFRFPMTSQEFEEWQRVFTEFTDAQLRPKLADAATWLRERNLQLNPNYNNEEDWKAEFYSPANLKKHPHRVLSLRSNDPRRIAYERQLTKNRLRLYLLLGLAVLVVWVILNGSAQNLWATITHYSWWITGAIVLIGATFAVRIHQQSRRVTDGE